MATVFTFGLVHITIINPIAQPAKQYEYLMEEIFGNNSQSDCLSLQMGSDRDVEGQLIINGELCRLRNHQSALH